MFSAELISSDVALECVLTMKKSISFIKNKLKQIIKHFIISAKERIRYHQSVKRICMFLLKPFPRLTERIKRIGSSDISLLDDRSFISGVFYDDNSDLTNDSRFVYEKIVEKIKDLDRGRFF